MRKINLFAATMLALSVSATAFAQGMTAPAPAPAPMAAPAPAPAAAPAPMAAPEAPAAEAPKPAAKKHMMKKPAGKLVATAAGDKAVEDLNDASFSAAKSGKPFVAPATPEAAKKDAHAGMTKPMKHKKGMAKKTEAAK